MDRDRVVVSDVFPPYLRRLRAQFGDYGNVTVAELDVTKPLEGVEGLRGDTVVCMNVLEHIEHDRDAVGRIGALLQPGGRTILLVPACPALYCAIDQHLGHYRRYSLAQVRSLLEHAGFAVEHSRYVNMLGAVGWFVNGRALRRNLLPSRQMRFFDRLVPLLSLERFLGPPFGLSVLAVGRKAAT
jgi:SAM-dependent methyltransferase